MEINKDSIINGYRLGDLRAKKVKNKTCKGCVFNESFTKCSISSAGLWNSDIVSIITNSTNDFSCSKDDIIFIPKTKLWILLNNLKQLFKR